MSNVISQLLSEFICNVDDNSLVYSKSHTSFLGIENTRTVSASLLGLSLNLEKI